MNNKECLRALPKWCTYSQSIKSVPDGRLSNRHTHVHHLTGSVIVGAGLRCWFITGLLHYSITASQIDFNANDISSSNAWWPKEESSIASWIILVSQCVVRIYHLHSRFSFSIMLLDFSRTNEYTIQGPSRHFQLSKYDLKVVFIRYLGVMYGFCDTAGYICFFFYKHLQTVILLLTCTRVIFAIFSYVCWMY